MSNPTRDLIVNVTDGCFIRFFDGVDIDPAPYVFPPVTDGDVIPVRLRFVQRSGTTYSAVTATNPTISIGERDAVAIETVSSWTTGTGDDDGWLLGTVTIANQEVREAISARTPLYVAITNDAQQVIQQLLATRLRITGNSRESILLTCADDDAVYEVKVALLNGVPTLSVSAYQS